MVIKCGGDPYGPSYPRSNRPIDEPRRVEGAGGIPDKRKEQLRKVALVIKLVKVAKPNWNMIELEIMGDRPIGEKVRPAIEDFARDLEDCLRKGKKWGIDIPLQSRGISLYGIAFHLLFANLYYHDSTCLNVDLNDLLDEERRFLISELDSPAAVAGEASPGAIRPPIQPPPSAADAPQAGAPARPAVKPDGEKVLNNLRLLTGHDRPSPDWEIIDLVTFRDFGVRLDALDHRFLQIAAQDMVSLLRIGRPGTEEGTFRHSYIIEDAQRLQRLASLAEYFFGDLVSHLAGSMWTIDLRHKPFQVGGITDKQALLADFEGPRPLSRREETAGQHRKISAAAPLAVVPARQAVKPDGPKVMRGIGEGLIDRIGCKPPSTISDGLVAPITTVVVEEPPATAPKEGSGFPVVEGIVVSYSEREEGLLDRWGHRPKRGLSSALARRCDVECVIDGRKQIVSVRTGLTASRGSRVNVLLEKNSDGRIIATIAEIVSEAPRSAFPPPPPAPESAQVVAKSRPEQIVTAAPQIVNLDKVGREVVDALVKKGNSRRNLGEALSAVKTVQRERGVLSGVADDVLAVILTRVLPEIIRQNCQGRPKDIERILTRAKRA